MTLAQVSAQKNVRLVALGFVVAFVLAGAGVFFTHSSQVQAATATPINGYVWSGFNAGSGVKSGLGWLCLSSATDVTSCGSGSVSYGVSEDSSSGALSGYAWSQRYGWVTFNAADVSTCPAGSASACAPKVNLSTGAVSGFIRACGSFASKSLCSGALDQNTGAFASKPSWDGWISLSGSNYGVTQSTSADGTCLYGWAWGGPRNIGWVSFSNTTDGSASVYGAYVGTNSACVGKVPPTAKLTASPNTIINGQSTTLTWSSTNAASCTAAGGFSTGGTKNGSVSVSPTNTATYGVTCGGTTDTATVNVLQPTTNISAAPTLVRRNDTTTITWSSTYTTGCVVSGPGLNLTSLNGSESVTIKAQSTFTITCNGASSKTTVNVLPSFQEI